VDELRKTYHDRIAALRKRTIEIVRDAADAVENVTASLLEGDLAGGHVVVTDAAAAAARVAAVESEVMDLLALQSPVARDLRLVLASWRIAQIAELCLGLARTLAGRIASAPEVMTPALRSLAYEIGAETVELLRKDNVAWTVLDADAARAVIAGADSSRDFQRRYLTELFGLRDISVEGAVDLGLTARAYERLTDHAVEIAERVLTVG